MRQPYLLNRATLLPLSSLTRTSSTCSPRVFLNRSFQHQSQYSTIQERNLPRIVQPSIWQSIVPRSLRSKSKKPLKPKPKLPSNPATYFIWIYILIGSQAIRILGIQNEFNTFMRKADLKLARLQEVIEKLQRGEEVDVEKVLGSGDEIQEQEWEEALREIESEERLWQNNKQRRRDEQDKLAKEQQDADPVNNTIDKAVNETATTISVPVAPGFY